MATGRTNQLTGAVGEFLVAAELCRLNLLATPFAGNVPHYDIIVSGPFGGHLAVQVRAINKSNWQFNIQNFADVQLCNEKNEQSKDGKRQIVGKRHPEPFPGLMYVLVVLKQRPEDRDRFFVLEWKELQDILVRLHEAYLLKHGGRLPDGRVWGIRPKKPASFHISLGIKDVESFENQWRKISDRIPGH
jgi:hypothetical protein